MHNAHDTADYTSSYPCSCRGPRLGQRSYRFAVRAAAARSSAHHKRAAHIGPHTGSTCSRLRHTAARAQTRQVVLTREQGKNEELMQALDARSISWLEMPLIEAAEGPDRSAEGLPLLQQLYTRLHTLGHRELLSVLLVEDQFDYVVLTSPEAAAVFISGWRDAGKPPVRIATVGTGTSRVLLADADAAALTPVFEPTKANAVHLSAELPEVVGGSKRVLYPASVKAGTDLQVRCPHTSFNQHTIFGDG